MVQDHHRHDFFFILALKKGMGSHEIDFTSHKVCDNVIFFMRPGQVHQLKLKAGSTGYLMEFKRDFYFPHDKLSKQLLREVGNRSDCRLEANAFKKLLDTMTAIFLEYTKKRERFEHAIKANLSIFFIELVRNRQYPRRQSNNVTPYMQERLEKFLELLETHIAEKKQVSEYAGMLNLSTYQLNAITKATLDKTCSGLINDHIILESKRYLLATSNQVYQLAYQLGYEDVSYFIRFFKKHTGQTPEAFRHSSGKSH